MSTIARYVRVFALALVSLIASACASAGRPDVSLASRRAAADGEAAPLGSSAHRLTADEIMDARVTSTGEAIRHLRPDFLRGVLTLTASGMTAVRPSVFLNGNYLGAPEVLETIALASIEEISLLRPAQARDRWGAYCQCGGGVILVRTKTDR